MLLPWHETNEGALGRRLLLSPLAALARIYAGGARMNRWAHERGCLSRTRLPCRVVSVGSLVAGGAGKTPTAAGLADRLCTRGHRVAILSRGYGRRSTLPVEIASDGKVWTRDCGRVGDEAPLLAAHAPGVPVLIARDRVLAGVRAIESFGAEVLVLDDGFQHHRLARDIEILTFDAGFGLGNHRTLPRGPLREDTRALARANAVGVIDGELSERDERLIRTYAPRAFRYRARRLPSRLRSLDGRRDLPLARLRDAPVGLLAGLGRPSSLERTLVSLGARVVVRRFFRDHHRYRAHDLAGLEKEASCWITSEKDALKISPEWASRLDLRVLEVEFEADEGDHLLDWLEDALRRSLSPGSLRRMK